MFSNKNVRVITDYRLDEKKQNFIDVRVTDTDKNIVVTVSRIGEDLVTTEREALERASKVITEGVGKLKDNFTMQFQVGNVILEPASKNKATGTPIPAVTTFEVKIDLQVKSGEEVVKQIVLARRNDDMLVAETDVVNSALELLGEA